MSFAVVVVACVALMAASLYLVVAWERRRARLLTASGTALGLRPFEKGEQLIVPSVEIMRKRGRTIGGVLEGSWNGDPIAVFDLSYPAGKNVSRTTVFVLRLSQPRIPEFTAIRKNPWLYVPITDLPRVEQAPPPLARLFRLYAPGGQWPYGVEVTQYLQGTNEWSFEGRGSGLFLYRRAKRAPTKNLRAWIDEAFTEAKGLSSLVSASGAASTIDDGDPMSAHQQTLTFKASFKIRG